MGNTCSEMLAGAGAPVWAAAEATQRKRPSDEELGYIKTDDSFSKIISDAGAALSEQLAELFDDAREEIKRRRS